MKVATLLSHASDQFWNITFAVKDFIPTSTFYGCIEVRSTLTY